MEILRDLSVGLVVDRIPPAPLAVSAVDRIPRDPLAELAVDRIRQDPSAGLAVDRIRRDLSAGLADAATASGCCASRHSERARCLTAQQSRRNKANRRNQMVKSEK